MQLHSLQPPIRADVQGLFDTPDGPTLQHALSTSLLLLLLPLLNRADRVPFKHRRAQHTPSYISAVVAAAAAAAAAALC
jgi:hypothetical protein